MYQVGYLGYYWYSTERIEDKWMSHVEITPDMKHVSIAVSLPYWNNQQEYRVTHGKIIINGEVYRKVLQKYANEAIHLIIAKDTDTEKLNLSIADWVRGMSDGESPNQGKSDLTKSVIKEYVSDKTTNWGAVELSFSNMIKTDHFPAPFKSNKFAEVTTPPPQV